MKRIRKSLCGLLASTLLISMLLGLKPKTYMAKERQFRPWP